MGQAKARGTREQRIDQAIAKFESLKPDHIICNNCQAKLTEITTVDSRGMKGIEAVFAARCEVCKHNTLAIRGDPDAVADLSLAMEESTGKEVKMGMIPVAEN